MTAPPTLLDANRLWVDSRVRALAQRRVEAPELLRLGGRLGGGEALEIGCGRRGTGLALAVQVFGADRVDGVDLHPASVRAAQVATRRVRGVGQVRVADATALDVADGSYDAVFCYHLLHHAAQWRGAVAEAARVLRPGGRLYVCEMTERFVDSRPLRVVSYHPADGDRPTPERLAGAVSGAGLRVLGQRTRYRGWWTALAARKT